jgi:hypothetical protein
MAQVLEHGNSSFTSRPKVQEESPEGLEELQRSYLILSPQGKRRHRLIVLGQKHLPAIRDGGERVWGYVRGLTRPRLARILPIS